jgi:hypothetical protein
MSHAYQHLSLNHEVAFLDASGERFVPPHAAKSHRMAFRAGQRKNKGDQNLGVMLGQIVGMNRGFVNGALAFFGPAHSGWPASRPDQD